MTIKEYLDPKSIRKLIYCWKQLIIPSNYLILETIDEYKRLGNIWEPRIQIDNIECFFNATAKEALRRIVNTIYEADQIRKKANYNLIYHKSIAAIEQTIVNRIKHNKTSLPEQDLESLINSINKECCNYEFVRPLEGLSLSNLERLPLGIAEIFLFTMLNESIVQKYQERVNNRFFNDAVVPYIKDHLLDKICIKTRAYGAAKTAEEIADKKIKQSINLIRFIFCILGHNRVNDQLVRINVRAESFAVYERNIAINLDKNSITLKGDSRKALQKFELDRALLENLRKYYFFDDWIRILSNEKKTQLEEAFLTSVYWIGEAQNDFISESAFVKYWTALETLFTIDEDSSDKKSIAEQLARGIAYLLALEGYHFIKVDEIGPRTKN